MIGRMLIGPARAPNQSRWRLASFSTHYYRLLPALTGLECVFR